MFNPNSINGVDVYLERRKTREYVGRLTFEDKKFIFTYHNKYLFKSNAIPLGPDLPLTKQKFSSEKLFNTFEDRIPSKKNPAYDEYCKMVGIHTEEKNPLILLATLGQRGPSSFIFAPVFLSPSISEDLIKFRKDLHLSIREFSELFDFAPGTINGIENKSISGKESMKRLEIYLNFPEVALYEVNKNRHKLNEQKIKYVEMRLQDMHKNSGSL